MGYYRAGGDELAPGEPAEEPIPDPLADDATRFTTMMRAYRRMKEKEESDVGYYRAGGSPASETDVALGPDSTDSTRGHVLGETHHRRGHRMNAMNIRAARRAIRRLTSFAKIARKVYTFTHKTHGQGHFKTQKKKGK